MSVLPVSQPCNNRLRVLNYNMYGVPFLDNRKQERFKRFTNEVLSQDKYDVYCFQEVFSKRCGFILRWIPYAIVLILHGIAWMLLKTNHPRASDKVTRKAKFINTYIVTGIDLIEGKIWSIFALLLYPLRPIDSKYNPFYWLNHRDKIHFINACKKSWGRVYSAQTTLSLNPMKFVDSGLLIVSRFPLKKVGEVRYGRDTLLEVDKLAAKGALFVIIDVPTTRGVAEKVVVSTTHLQAGYGEGVNMEARIKQVASIGHSLDAMKVKGGDKLCTYSCIITGDFNTCCYRENGSYQKMITDLNAFEARTVEDVIGKMQPGACTEGGRRVDYILSNLACESCSVVEYNLSDHRAVEAVFVVTGEFT